MAKHFPQALKDEILIDIKNGLTVADASTKYGIRDKTIYYWLRGQVDNTGTSSLELAKLRKENTELKELIGWLTLEKKRGEKNQRR